MTTEPQYTLMTASRDGLVRDLPAGHEDQRGVSNSATLIWDGNDAILVDTLTQLKELHPTHVVSAHKDPGLGNPPSDIDATIRYLRDVADFERTASEDVDFYQQMLIREPERRNIGSLWGAATAILPGSSDPAPHPPAHSTPQH